MMNNKKYITSAIILSGLCIIGSQGFASENMESENDSIAITMDNLKRQADQDYSKALEEVNKVNPDTSISKFGMDVAKTRFDNVVFLGDSITEYLRTQSILNPDSVLAKKGEHLGQASKHIDEIKKIKPEKLVILYGANDLDSSFETTYKEKYIDLINKIKAEVPNVKIYLQAPLPVYEQLSTKRNPNYNNQNIKIMDGIVKNVAKETHTTYIPSSDLGITDSMYEPDGIHFKYQFYKNWLYYLSSIV